jgi:hypothetical protein
MSVQSVIAHADAKARAHPEEEERDSQCMPTEHEQCGDRPEVEKAEGDAVGPVYFSRIGYVDQVGAHGASWRHAISKTNRDFTCGL